MTTTTVPTNPELEADNASDFEEAPVEETEAQAEATPEGDRLASLEQHDAEARRIAMRILDLRDKHECAKANARAAKKALEAAHEALADHAMQKLTFGPLFDENAADDEQWRTVSVDELVDHGATAPQIAKLTGKAPPIRTLGDLSSYLDDDYTRLTDIEGVGTKAAEAIEDALGAWFAANPEMCPPVKLADGELALVGVEDEEDDDAGEDDEYEDDAGEDAQADEA